METAKDIFYFLGSILGILAFIRTSFQPVLEQNRQRWKQVTEKIDEELIISLEYQIWHVRSVDRDCLNRLYYFVDDIEEGAEYLRFGPLYEGEFEKRKKNIVRLYRELRDYIQVPYWEPERHANENGEETSCWSLNKKYFREAERDLDLGSKKYSQHLYEAAEIAEKIRREYRAMSVLANLHMIELPFAKRIVRKRSAIPKRDANEA